jgi:hypothetical protein
MLAVTMAWFGQFSGNNVSSYYLPVMLDNVGVTKVSTVLLLNAVYAITGWIAAITGGKICPRLKSVESAADVSLSSSIA